MLLHSGMLGNNVFDLDRSKVTYLKYSEEE
jgi:hypothetical protein